jgi:hypothetical protein
MRISVFNGNQPNQMGNAKKVSDVPLSELGNIICKFAWSPTVFKKGPYTNEKGQDKGSFYRNNKNVESMEGIGLDFDGDRSIEEIKTILIERKLAAVIGTTRNHQKVKISPSGKSTAPRDRFRVVMKFDRPLKSDAELKALWPKIVRFFPGLDEACKDTARFYFPCKKVVAVTKGRDFSSQPDPLSKHTRGTITVPKNSKTGVKEKGKMVLKTKGRMAQATNDFIVFGAEDGLWHSTFFKAGIDLKEQGYTFEEARKLIRKASTNSNRELDEQDLYQLKDIYKNREPKYEPRIAIKDYFEEITDWPSPKELPPALPPVPPMPIELIPESLRDFVNDVSERLQTPAEMVIGPLLASIATLVGRRLGIRPKRNDTSWVVVPVIWNLIVARPSKKKTPAIRAATKGLNAIQQKALEEYGEKYKSAKSEEEFYQSRINGIKEEIKKTSKKETAESALLKLKNSLQETMTAYDLTKVVPKRYITNDATVEKLHEILKDNPDGIAMIRDELEGWARGLDKQGREGDREFYLEAWDGMEAKSIDRIGRGSVHATAICVHIIGGMQPGKFEKYVYDANNGGKGDDGLLQRFQLLFYPDPNIRMPYIDRRPDKNAAHKVNSIFNWLNDTNLAAFDSGNSDPIPTVRFSVNAQNVFDEWMEKLENGLQETGAKYGGGVESHFGKYRSLMPALALLFHLTSMAVGNTLETVVSKKAAILAVKWCAYLELHALKVYSVVSRSDIYSAHALAQKIKSGEVVDGVSLRTIYRKHWSALTTPAELEPAATILQDVGWLKIQSVGTGGAPTDLIRINPALTSLVDKKESEAEDEDPLS